MKKLTGLLLIFVGILLSSGVAVTEAEAVSDSPLGIQIDGQDVYFGESQPFVDSEGRTQVPVRFISEDLGYLVNWDGTNEVVTILGEGKTINLYIGSSQYTVSGELREMDTSPQLVDGRTVVPLRFVGEALDLYVGWNEATNTVALGTDGVGEAGEYDDRGESHDESHDESQDEELDEQDEPEDNMADGDEGDNGLIDVDNFDLDRLSRKVFEETNDRRRDYGRSVLEYNELFSEAATIHSEEMGQHEFVGHSNHYNTSLREPGDRLDYVGADARAWSENVLEFPVQNVVDESDLGGTSFNYDIRGDEDNFTYDRLADLIVEGWMRSSGHRENLLNDDAQELGVGIALQRDVFADQDEDYGINLDKVYVTQKFKLD